MKEAPTRLELKYQISRFDYYRMRSILLPYVVEDGYMTKASSEGYLVRSLYFDTPHFSAYKEKRHGEKDRVKLRARVYTNSPEANQKVSLEFKLRLSDKIAKHSCTVSLEEFESFLQTHTWENADDPVKIEYERRVRDQLLRPVVLVDYRREAYFAKDSPATRITFDHDLKVASSRELFPKDAVFRRPNNNIVLEIKCRSTPPTWISRFCSISGLKTVPNSKYAQAIEVSEPAILR